MKMRMYGDDQVVPYNVQLNKCVCTIIIVQHVTLAERIFDPCEKIVSGGELVAWYDG